MKCDGMLQIYPKRLAHRARPDVELLVCQVNQGGAVLLEDALRHLLERLLGRGHVSRLRGCLTQV